MDNESNIHAEMSRELTCREAKALAESEWWKKLDIAEAARLQLYQDRLCMPFGTFHEGMERLLHRPVWSHEFAGRDALIAEVEGKPPTNPLESFSKIFERSETC
jgi:hypothetical protein